MAAAAVAVAVAAAAAMVTVKNHKISNEKKISGNF